jgi:hypothetical protein
MTQVRKKLVASQITSFKFEMIHGINMFEIQGF